MASNLSDEQFRLLCLLHFAEEAMRDTFAHFITNQTLVQKKKPAITTDAVNPCVAFAQVLNFLPKSIVDDVERHFHKSSTKIYNSIFTSTASGTYTVNTNVDISMFDISALYYCLTMNVDAIPTRKALFRKKDGRLVCCQPSHLKKCCTQCEAAKGKSHGVSNSHCSFCNASHYDCYNDHTPCCVTCNTCDACALIQGTTCTNRTLRNSINFVHNLRNLSAHSNQQAFVDLQAGTFFDQNFPSCTAWNDLWNQASNHVIALFDFLHSKGVIDLTTHIIKTDEIKTKLPLQSIHELSKVYTSVILRICDDSNQQVAELNKTVSDLSDRVQNLAQLNTELLEKVESRYRSFQIKFLMCEDEKDCWKMLNNFLHYKPTITKQDFSLKSELSNTLEQYLQALLSNFIGHSTSIMVTLKDIRYNDLEKGHVYKLVVSPKSTDVISRTWYKIVEERKEEVMSEVKRCIRNAVYIEKKLMPEVFVYHITFGSIVLTVFVDELRDHQDNVIDFSTCMERCQEVFDIEDLHISQCEHLANKSLIEVLCDFNVYGMGTCESLAACIEGGVKYIKDAIRGPGNNGHPLEVLEKKDTAVEGASIGEDIKYDVIFCGNPGVGKSTLLSSISEILFLSGFSWAEGLTVKMEFKENPKFPGVRFGDTPGLVDINNAKHAAEEITAALKEGTGENKRTLLFFVTTLESGRIKPEELFTIKLVMESITLQDGKKTTQNCYGVIVNKCTFLEMEDFEAKGRAAIERLFGVYSDTVPFTTNYITFLPYVPKLVDKENGSHTFEGFQQWVTALPGMNISSIKDIDISSLEEKLDLARSLHQRNMERMQKYYKQNMIEVQREMGAMRSALEREMHYTRSHQRHERCIIS